jgi:hypothetical protein
LLKRPAVLLVEYAGYLPVWIVNKRFAAGKIYDRLHSGGLANGRLKEAFVDHIAAAG